MNFSNFALTTQLNGGEKDGFGRSNFAPGWLLLEIAMDLDAWEDDAMDSFL